MADAIEGTPTVLSGEITASTVDFPWIKQGVSVGPDDVLVIAVEGHLSPSDLRPFTDHLTRILGPNRYIIIAGMSAQIGRAPMPMPCEGHHPNVLRCGCGYVKGIAR